MKQEMKNVGFSATQSMRDELRKRAEDLGVSKSALIKLVLADWLSSKEHV